MTVKSVLSLLVVSLLLIGAVPVGAQTPEPAASPAVAEPPFPGTPYTVKAGDTLASVAEAQLGEGVPPEVLVVATNAYMSKTEDYTPITIASELTEGDTLYIPDPSLVPRFTEAPAPGELGSAQKPVQLYFVPSVEAQVIVESGEDMAAYFKETTGIEVNVEVPTSYSAVIEAMGAAEGDIVGFIPALAYVLAHERYGVDVSLAVERQGRSWYTVQFIARADSDINTLEDLDGKIWAYPDEASTSGYMVPLTVMNRNGINPGRQFAAGGHPNVVIAVYDGSADFGTTFYSPPGGPDDWNWGDPPEPPGEVVVEEVEGRLVARKGGLQLRDARSAVLSTYPDVFEKVKIVALGDRIPNDTVSFVKDFDPIVRARIVQTLLDYASTERGQSILANDQFYDINGFDYVTDAAYDPIRDMVQAVGIDLEEQYGLN